MKSSNPIQHDNFFVLIFKAIHKHRMSMVLRITIHTLLMVMISLAIYTCLSLYQFKQAMNEQTNAIGTNLALQVASSATEHLVADDNLGLNVLLGDLVKNPLVAYASIRNPDQHLLAKAGTLPPSKLFTEQDGLFTQSIDFQSISIGQLDLVLDLKKFQGPMIYSLNNMLLLSLILLLVVVFLTLRLGRNVTSPIIRLTHWLDYLSSPTPGSQRNDEIGDLAKKLQQDFVQVADNKNLNLHDDLESEALFEEDSLETDSLFKTNNSTQISAIESNTLTTDAKQDPITSINTELLTEQVEPSLEKSASNMFENELQQIESANATDSREQDSNMKNEYLLASDLQTAKSHSSETAIEEKTSTDYNSSAQKTSDVQPNKVFDTEEYLIKEKEKQQAKLDTELNKPVFDSKNVSSSSVNSMQLESNNENVKHKNATSLDLSDIVFDESIFDFKNDSLQPIDSIKTENVENHIKRKDTDFSDLSNLELDEPVSKSDDELLHLAGSVQPEAESTDSHIKHEEAAPLDLSNLELNEPASKSNDELLHLADSVQPEVEISESRIDHKNTSSLDLADIVFDESLFDFKNDSRPSVDAIKTKTTENQTDTTNITPLTYPELKTDEPVFTLESNEIPKVETETPVKNDTISHNDNLIVKPTSHDSNLPGAVLAVRLKTEFSDNNTAYKELAASLSTYLDKIAALYRCELHFIPKSGHILIFNTEQQGENYLIRALCAGELIRTMSYTLQGNQMDQEDHSVELQLGMTQSKGLYALEENVLSMHQSVQDALILAGHSHNLLLVQQQITLKATVSQCARTFAVTKPKGTRCVERLLGKYPALIEEQAAHINK